MEFDQIMDAVSRVVDAAGVAVIVLGMVAASGAAALRARTGAGPVYGPYRQQLARSILLGLEFLVAADIIRTVAVEPTFSGVGVLAIIVLIRTFLSFAMELEIHGQWPWQAGAEVRTDRGGAG